MKSVYFSDFHFVKLEESFFNLGLFCHGVYYEGNSISLLHIFEVLVRSDRLDQDVMIVDVLVGFLFDFIFDGLDEDWFGLQLLNFWSCESKLGSNFVRGFSHVLLKLFGSFLCLLLLLRYFGHVTL